MVVFLRKNTIMVDGNEFNRLFGLHVKKLRKNVNLSQEDLADLIGKSVDTVSNIERGKTYPRIETIVQMANAFNVEIFEMFQVKALSHNDSDKNRLLIGIVDLLQDQPKEVIEFTFEQTRSLVALQRQLFEKIRR